MNQSIIHEIADAFGTPLYVYRFGAIKEQIDKIRKNMHPQVKLFYSMKANPNPTLTSKIHSAGVNLEICSPLEFAVCKMIGVSPDRILYLGPGKSEQEIREAIQYGVKYLVVESIQELVLVNQLAKEANRVIHIGIRLNPEVAVKGAKLQMGGKPRQFGIDEKQFSEFLPTLNEYSNIQVHGIHTYHGTRILSARTIVENISYILQSVKKIMDEHPLDLRYVGIGGGLGISYFEGEEELDIEELGRDSFPYIDQFLKSYPGVEILMESGRYLVGESGTYITKVQYTKTSQEVNFAVMDGGTHHHSASGSGNALMKNFPIRAFIEEEREQVSYSLSGPLCTPNDVFGKKVKLPRLQRGDLVGILKVGAYGLTASPILFLSHHLPKEVLIEDNEMYVIRDHDEYLLPKVRT